MPSVTTSMRVAAETRGLAADAVADGCAHRLAQASRPALGGGAGGEAARLQHHDAAGEHRTSSASGTRVVLPAPGGA